MPSLGIFDLICDIISKIVITKVETYGFVYYSWYMRLCFVALLVCNLPYTWSLMLDTFPGIRTWTSESSVSSMPKFWSEKKWYHSMPCCGASRKGKSVNMQSNIVDTAQSTINDEAKSPQIGIALANQRQDPKVDAAVIERMVKGQLEDRLKMGTSHSQRGLLDVEKQAGEVGRCSNCGHHQS